MSMVSNVEWILTNVFQMSHGHIRLSIFRIVHVI